MTKFMINNRRDAWKTDVNLLNRMPQGDYQTIVPAQRKWVIKDSLLLQFFLDKMKRIYRPMSILARREQEKYFF